jgi:Tfp pilus assembly protein PilF
MPASLPQDDAQPALSPVGEAIIAAPQRLDSEMGDSASQPALDRLNQAIASLRTIRARPLLERATAALRAEDYKSGAELALEALQLDERNGFAWYVLAIAREKVGDFKSAIQCYESALALTPNHAEIANDLGRLAFRLGLKAEAAQFFAHFCAAKPGDLDGANNLACALRDLHHYDSAIEILRTAIQANPENASLWNSLGTVLHDQGRSAEATPFFAECLRLEPSFCKARYNLANARRDCGDVEGALADCDAAMQGAMTEPERAMMRLARSTLLLCNGRVGEGWDDYEARVDPNFLDVTRFLIDRPRWRPEDDLAGKSLLLIGEQGLGDEVLFANTVPDLLEALGPQGRLTLALEKRLLPLFRRSFPTAEIDEHTSYKLDGHLFRTAHFVEPSGIDLWAPMASPLRRFRRSVEAYPDKPGFLVADPERIAWWRDVLGALPGPKVGLLWKSMKLDGARLRQFSPFEQWRPVLETQGVSFVNLQYGDCAAELAHAREALGLEIWQPPGIDLKNDLDDVAALCCAMDLIIGPANATSSLAAACGAPLWMISTPAAWPRLGTDRYPWYPQVRAFVPDGYQQWDELMPQVAAALAERVQAAGT